MNSYNSDNDSHTLQRFIQSLPNSLKRQYANIKFSPESRILLAKIANTMHTAYSTRNDVGDIRVDHLAELPTGPSYDLIDSEIKPLIREQCRHFYCANFEISSRQFRIFLSFRNPVNQHSNDRQILREYVLPIYTWLTVACKPEHSITKCSRVLDIYIYMTDAKKTLPETDGAVLDHTNANTAFTFACKPKNEIYVYREEEWLKVVIHETFHSLGLDFSSMSPLNTKEVEEYVCGMDKGSLFKIKCDDLRFYEAYTETWAEVLHILLNETIHNIHVNQTVNIDTNIDTIIDASERAIREYEAPFSVFQCAKVLDHFGLLYRDLKDESIAKSYREITPVFAYYVIKSVFMANIDAFVLWTTYTNRGTLQFKKTVNAVRSFAHLLRDLLRDDGTNVGYIDKIQQMEDVVENERMSEFVLNTMRMTC